MTAKKSKSKPKPKAKPPAKAVKKAAKAAPKKSAPAKPAKTAAKKKPATGPKISVTERKNPITAKPAAESPVAKALEKKVPANPASSAPKPAKPKAVKSTLEDLPLDIEEKEELAEEEKRDLVKALREEDDGAEATFVPTDTSERYILVVDEEGRRRGETVTIVSQILPNAVVEVADDPDEALEMMQDCEFDTFVVNFLMPGYSASPFVKAVANHAEHPLLIGFAADKISDAVDPKKGLKIIPLKRLFDLDSAANAEAAEGDGTED